MEPGCLIFTAEIVILVAVFLIAFLMYRCDLLKPRADQLFNSKWFRSGVFALGVALIVLGVIFMLNAVFDHYNLTLFGIGIAIAVLGWNNINQLENLKQKQE